jgi:membrane protein DedA with SNARE-associated domain
VFALLQESFIAGSFGRIGYFAPFLFLVGAGAGLPVPEEVTMVGSGYLYHQGEVQFLNIVATCWCATLVGDSIPFWLGRLLGERALGLPLVSRALHPERFALIEKRFAEHGNWAVFTCRFLPGVRMPGFFSAGTLRMSYLRFILIDALGACLMVPMYISLGSYFGKRIAALERTLQNSTQTLGFVLVLLVVSIAIHFLARRRDRQVARLEHKAGVHGPPAPPAPPGDGRGGP